MANKKRCVVCRGYCQPNEMVYSQGMTNVCSSECLSEYMGKRRDKHRAKPAAVPAKPKRMAPVIPIAVRVAVHERDGNLCRNCGAKGTQCHHIVFRSAGGKHELSNLILLCSHCHLELAHGAESRVWRELFLAYIWLAMVQQERLFLPQVREALVRSESPCSLSTRRYA